MKKLTAATMLAVTLAVGFALGTLSAENQPHMKAALSQLGQAKDSLQKATADKGGHRAKAIALVNEAIEEVKKGIAADNAR